VAPQYFDLNVEKVLEHWTVAHAVRELLANALDEHLLGHGDVPVVERITDRTWRIRDYGRGLRHEHFTQNENDEKLTSDAVIGRFGVGLKDALAVLDRHGVDVRICTATADVTTAVHPKSGFPDTTTLHAVFDEPSDRSLAGTEVVLTGVGDEDVEAAKRFFRRWNDELVLDSTPYGDLLAKSGEVAFVYVRGVRVAEEETFLFSYDVTRFNAKLARALNRERSNVGRQAYGDRVKDILLAARSPEAMTSLIADLGEFQSGGQHTESTWVDVALHASKVVSATGEVVFVTPNQLASGGPLFDYARDEGRRLLVVPTKVMDRLKDEVDVDGNPIRTLEVFAKEWMRSFAFDFVDQASLTDRERGVLARVPEVFGLLGLAPDEWPIRISRTMRPGAKGVDAAGVWDGQQIVLQRGELRSLRRFCATLLHEIAHARTGTDDATLEFESALTDQLGVLGEAALGLGGAGELRDEQEVETAAHDPEAGGREAEQDGDVDEEPRPDRTDGE
jgi:hypothetical protein